MDARGMFGWSDSQEEIVRKVRQAFLRWRGDDVPTSELIDRFWYYPAQAVVAAIAELIDQGEVELVRPGLCRNITRARACTGG